MILKLAGKFPVSVFILYCLIDFNKHIQHFVSYLSPHFNNPKTQGNNSNCIIFYRSVVDRTQLGGSFIRLQSDGCWGWSHLEGYLTHRSGDSCWLLAKTSPRAIYIWLLHVAWAFSQHGGWIPGGNVPRPGRSYMIYFQKSHGIFPL